MTFQVYYIFSIKRNLKLYLDDFQDGFLTEVIYARLVVIEKSEWTLICKKSRLSVFSNQNTERIRRIFNE
ncbi:hypothetical protein DP117_00420 [Brasilonema sp. UFV-L1]|nr:hypothetical protein [Brasilonema sp. UFV-L1]